jgi:hypothetical protein
VDQLILVDFNLRHLNGYDLSRCQRGYVLFILIFKEFQAIVAQVILLQCALQRYFNLNATPPLWPTAGNRTFFKIGEISSIDV